MGGGGRHADNCTRTGQPMEKIQCGQEVTFFFLESFIVFAYNIAYNGSHYHLFIYMQLSRYSKEAIWITELRFLLTFLIKKCERWKFL
jgi:hypothetical protein